MTDTDLVTLLDLVRDCYLAADLPAGDDGPAPSARSRAENKEAMRLFGEIADRDLRAAVLSLLRVLAWPADEMSGAAPSARYHPAANRPG